MRFRLSPDGHIIRTHHEPSVTDTNAMVFASEPEFRKLAAGGWPMKRLVEIWNQLPGVRPVQRFDSRDRAVARIWRAIQPGIEQSLPASALCSVSPVHHRVSFREGSKAAEVCTLLFRPEGVTLREIMSATGWQAHTCAGFSPEVLGSRAEQFGPFTATANACTIRTLRRNGLGPCAASMRARPLSFGPSAHRPRPEWAAL
jgi:hypothetical protein